MTDERFVQVVSELTPLALRVAAVFVSVTDAEDAAQEAILRAWPTLRDTEASQHWLHYRPPTLLTRRLPV